MFKNNKIYVVDKNNKKRRIFWKKGLKFIFHGSNNTVVLGYKARFKNSVIELGEHRIKNKPIPIIGLFF